MKRNILVVMLIAILTIIGCKIDERNSDYWYAPNYPELMEPKLGENLDYFDWGFLLPNEQLIASGDGWEAYCRGDFEDYSVLFALSDRGIHSPEWKDRLVEVYPDHAEEIIIPTVKLFTMDARKYEDGTYSYSDYETGIFHIDSNGEILHQYLDYNNGHESLIDFGDTDSDDRILSYSFETGIARITDWDGNIYWEWNQNEEIEEFNPDNYANLEYHYGTQFDKEGNPTYRVYDPIQIIRDNQADGGIGLNRVQILNNGHKLLSLRNCDLIIEVDKNNKVVWSFGPMVVRHPHCCTMLENGNVLVHDTGNNRIIEVTKEHEIVWEFNSGMVCPYMGMAQRLPNGNTVFTDGLRTTAICVTPDGDVIWEVYIKGKDTLTRTEALKYSKKVLPGFRIYRAWCYEIEGG